MQPLLAMPAPAAAPAAAPDTTEPAMARSQPPVAVIDILDRDGHVRQTHPVAAWPFSIGRALDNDLVLTDPYVASHHLSIEPDGADGLVVAVGDTRNGALLGRERLRQGERRRVGNDLPMGDRRSVANGMATPAGVVETGASLAPEPVAAKAPLSAGPAELTVGRTRLRLHLASQAAAPELALAAVVPLGRRVMPIVVGAALLLAMQLFSTWLASDPDGLGRAIGSTLMTTVGGALVWCGAWSLLSKTFARQARFGWHLQIFLWGGIGLLLVGVVPAALAFAFSWPAVTDFAFIATFAVGAVAIYFHLLAVEPSRPRLLRWVVASGALAGIALTLWLNVGRTDLYGDELYMSHLFPPAMRLARPVAPDRFIDGLAALKPVLDRKAKQDDSSDPGPVSNGDGDGDQ